MESRRYCIFQIAIFKDQPTPFCIFMDCFICSLLLSVIFALIDVILLDCICDKTYYAKFMFGS